MNAASLVYRIAYMKIWTDCMRAGYTTNDARAYAEMEVQSQLKKVHHA